MGRGRGGGGEGGEGVCIYVCIYRYIYIYIDIYFFKEERLRSVSLITLTHFLIRSLILPSSRH